MSVIFSHVDIQVACHMTILRHACVTLSILGSRPSAGTPLNLYDFSCLNFDFFLLLHKSNVMTGLPFSEYVINLCWMIDA